MSKHTPAPWRWEGDKMRGAERKLVKTSQHETLHPERAAANRALIAAAPDLLEALHEARDVVYWSECDDDFSDDMARYGGPVSMKGRALLRRIDAVIAKAEGR